jgi:hypothetical protein
MSQHPKYIYCDTQRLKPEELAEWTAAQAEIERLTQRLKLLARRAKERYGRRPTKRELAELRAARIAAHPDKGGSHEAFVAANIAYQRATRMGK